MRTTITTICFLTGLCFSLNASAQDAQDAPTEADVPAAVTAALGPMSLFASTYAPQRGVLMKYARGAVRNVVNNGLVLVNVGTETSGSRLFIKFGSDGMPQLRWRTRFGAL